MTERVSYAATDVLGPEEVALGLRVSVDTVDRMDLPWCWLGGRTRRIAWGTVLDILRTRAKAA